MAKKHKIINQQGSHGELSGGKVMNLGHETTADKLTQNPTGFELPPCQGKDSELAKSLRRDNNARGQYGPVGKLDSGISSEHNLHKWGKFSEKNSYQRDPQYQRGYPKNRDK